MLPQAVDFRAEAEDLHALLASLVEADWQRATLFKGWTVNDIVQHLHEGDLMAAASVAGADPFASMRAEMQTLRDSGMSRLEATRHRFAGLTGRRLLERWHATMLDLCNKLSAMPPETRLKWAGPDMGVRMFTTARQMETWAHGQAIFDVMGAPRAAHRPAAQHRRDRRAYLRMDLRQPWAADTRPGALCALDGAVRRCLGMERALR